MISKIKTKATSSSITEHDGRMVIGHVITKIKAVSHPNKEY